MRFEQFSSRTEEPYWVWGWQYNLFYEKRHSRELGMGDIALFLSHLAAVKELQRSAKKTKTLRCLCFVVKK